MKRKYLAIWDDGHDTGSFYFYSEHRAKSKANLEDAYKEYRRKHGNSHKIKIVKIYLEEE